MVRNLLATTAIATLLATGAYAQTAPAPTQPGMTMPAESAPMVKKAEGHLASNLIGKRVYNGTGDQAENIGSVNDIVIGPDGQVKAIVVGVGGFLGLGQKNVALEYSLAQWVERDNDEWIVVETTEDALKALPEFDLAAFQFRPADTEVGQTEPATADDLAIAATPVETEGEPATDTMAAAPLDPAPGTATDQPADQTAAAPAEDGAMTTDEEVAEAPADDAATADEEIAQAPAASDGETLTDDTQTAAIDRSTLNEVEIGQISADDFIGTTVYGANDENVGEVGDIIMSADGSSVDAVILDVGGFLGIGEKQVALGLDNLHFMRDASGEFHVYTNLTKEQLDAQAAYEETGYATQRDTMRLIVPN